jgi:protein-S-isoprenylcysteine O-methyltransferase Ste14
VLGWGLVSLGPNLTPATEPLPNGALVVHGAYRFVRHPIYLGVTLLLWAVAWWHTGPEVGFAIGLVALLYFDRKAAVEERWMARRFPGYADYRARVPKILPGRRRVPRGPAGR